MRAWTRLASFCRTLFHGRRLDAELDEEIRSYVDEVADRKVAAGIDPVSARRRAVVELGGFEQVKEQVRDVRPELVDLDVGTSSFEGFAGIWATRAALTDREHPEQLRVGLVTPDFFALLGANAALGRTFLESDIATGPPTVILLRHALFERRYGADPSVVGGRVLVNGQPGTVVGVMPSGFRLLMPPDASVPDDLDAWLLFDRRRIPEAPRGQRFLRVIGRIRAGATLAEANEDVRRVGAEISKAYTDYGAAGRKFDMVPLHTDVVRERLPAAASTRTMT